MIRVDALMASIMLSRLGLSLTLKTNMDNLALPDLPLATICKKQEN